MAPDRALACCLKVVLPEEGLELGFIDVTPCAWRICLPNREKRRKPGRFSSISNAVGGQIRRALRVRDIAPICGAICPKQGRRGLVSAKEGHTSNRDHLGKRNTMRVSTHACVTSRSTRRYSVVSVVTSNPGCPPRHLERSWPQWRTVDLLKVDRQFALGFGNSTFTLISLPPLNLPFMRK